MISKRYRDIFERYVHRGESTPFSIGTFAVCALCFLLLIVATFTQFDLYHPWISSDFTFVKKYFTYNPIIPAMILTIYILGKNFSMFLFVVYLIVGLTLWPIFAYGGGLGYFQNYLFGYFLGFFFAILITGTILNINQTVKFRLLSGLFGIFAIHATGLVYCVILSIFKVIDFSFIIPIVKVMSLSKITYDIIFTSLVILIAPYIKNILWVAMKPKIDRLKNTCKRNKIIGNDIYEHWQNYN